RYSFRAMDRSNHPPKMPRKASSSTQMPEEPTKEGAGERIHLIPVFWNGRARSLRLRREGRSRQLQGMGADIRGPGTDRFLEPRGILPVEGAQGFLIAGAIARGNGQEAIGPLLDPL